MTPVADGNGPTKPITTEAITNEVVSRIVCDTIDLSIDSLLRARQNDCLPAWNSAQIERVGARADSWIHHWTSGGRGSSLVVL